MSTEPLMAERQPRIPPGFYSESWKRAMAAVPEVPPHAWTRENENRAIDAAYRIGPSLPMPTKAGVKHVVNLFRARVLVRLKLKMPIWDILDEYARRAYMLEANANSNEGLCLSQITDHDVSEVIELASEFVRSVSMK